MRKTQFAALAAAFAMLLSTPFTVAQPQNKPKAKLDDVWCVAVSKDGKVAAAGSGWWDQPGEIGVWNLDTRKPLQRFAYDLGVSSLAFSSDGKLLASGSWTRHLRIYDWVANREIADFEDVGVCRVAFSPDDKLIASATEQMTVQLWDVEKRELLASLDGDLIRFQCVMFSPDGSKVLAGGGAFDDGGINHVVVWDVKTRQQIMKLVGHDLVIMCMAYSPDGSTIVTGSADNTIRFWDANTGAHLKTLKGHSNWLQSLVFMKDGKTLVSSAHDRTIRFWDVETGMEKPDRITLAGSVRALQVTPDGKSLLVGGGPRLFKIFDAVSSAEVATLWSAKEDPMAAQKVALEEVQIAAPTRTPGRIWLLAGLAMLFAIVLLLLAVLAVRYLMARSAMKSSHPS